VPVSLSSKLGGAAADGEPARIEIIPLIDIMFFLLASFMLVSLGMINLKRVPVNLPAAATAETAATARDLLPVSVDKRRLVYIERQPYGPNELRDELRRRHAANPRLRVLVNGDRDASHGTVLGALDAVRAAGFEHVSIQTAATGGGAGGGGHAP